MKLQVSELLAPHFFLIQCGITRWPVSEKSGPDDKFSESFPFQAPHFRVLHVVNSRWLPHERSACVGKHPRHQGLHRIANDNLYKVSRISKEKGGS